MFRPVCLLCILQRTVLHTSFMDDAFLIFINPLRSCPFFFLFRNKRLGCAKSTMFSIGGVSALKQHAFFEFIDWQALERLQVTPPFNFTPDTTQRCPGSVNGVDKNASPAPAQGIDGDNFALQFFDAEFTNQQLSLSMLEDTLQSPMNGGTPMRSGAVSRDEGES